MISALAEDPPHPAYSAADERISEKAERNSQTPAETLIPQHASGLQKVHSCFARPDQFQPVPFEQSRPFTAQSGCTPT